MTMTWKKLHVVINKEPHCGSSETTIFNISFQFTHNLTAIPIYCHTKIDRKDVLQMSVEQSQNIYNYQIGMGQSMANVLG